jgi:hypothetical protein
MILRLAGINDLELIALKVEGRSRVSPYIAAPRHGDQAIAAP